MSSLRIEHKPDVAFGGALQHGRRVGKWSFQSGTFTQDLFYAFDGSMKAVSMESENNVVTSVALLENPYDAPRYTHHDRKTQDEVLDFIETFYDKGKNGITKQDALSVPHYAKIATLQTDMHENRHAVMNDPSRTPLESIEQALQKGNMLQEQIEEAKHAFAQELAENESELCERVPSRCHVPIVEITQLREFLKPSGNVCAIS